MAEKSDIRHVIEQAGTGDPQAIGGIMRRLYEEGAFSPYGRLIYWPEWLSYELVQTLVDWELLVRESGNSATFGHIRPYHVLPDMNVNSSRWPSLIRGRDDQDIREALPGWRLPFRIRKTGIGLLLRGRKLWVIVLW